MFRARFTLIFRGESTHKLDRCWVSSGRRTTGIVSVVQSIFLFRKKAHSTELWERKNGRGRRALQGLWPASRFGNAPANRRDVTIDRLTDIQCVPLRYVLIDRWLKTLGLICDGMSERNVYNGYPLNFLQTWESVWFHKILMHTEWVIVNEKMNKFLQWLSKVSFVYFPRCKIRLRIFLFWG